MNRLIECNLIINSEIDGKMDFFEVNGKGYFKDNNEERIIYFTCDDFKYKYVYRKGNLTIYCNDSCYVFKENEKGVGKIKNGDYIFEITTLASRIEFFDNKLLLDYCLSQQGSVIGKYTSELTIK